jgi:hypothetical protein
MKPRVFVVALLVLASGGWWLRARPEARLTAKPAASEDGDEPSPGAASTSPPVTAPSSSTGPDLPALARAKRDAMRELIYRAFGQPLPPSPKLGGAAYVLPEHGPYWTGTEGEPGDAEPGIEPEYVRESVRQQFFPVANKCYASALETNPKLGGQIDLWFVIAGDSKIGGIVESVDVLDKSTLRDPDVIECLRESFLGVTFPPPKGGGVVTVEYPIAFSNDEDGG